MDYLYNGKEEEEEFGWLAYGFRHYDPQIGRFSGVDPLAEQFAAYNPYHYVHNNPISLIDPTGMNAENGGDPIGFKQNSYTQNEDYSHTIETHQELSTTNEEEGVITRTIITEKVHLSAEGEVLSSSTETIIEQSEILGTRTVFNHLDGDEYQTTRVGETEEISSTLSECADIESMSTDMQKIVSTIQTHTTYNQRYDYIKRDAAKDNFMISAAYATGRYISKAPRHVGYIGGLITGAAIYHNTTRDNRGRTVTTVPEVITKL